MIPSKDASNGMVIRKWKFAKWITEVTKLATDTLTRAKNKSDNEADAKNEVEQKLISDAVADAENRAKMYAIAIEKVLVIAKSDTVDSETKKAVLGLEAIIKTA